MTARDDTVSFLPCATHRWSPAPLPGIIERCVGVAALLPPAEPQPIRRPPELNHTQGVTP